MSFGVSQNAVAPCCSNDAFTRGLSSAFLASSEHFSTIAGGRPAGPQMPPHEVISKPGSVSAMVGMSLAAGWRSLEVTATPRTLPPRIRLSGPGMLSHIMSTWLASRSW